MATFRPIIFTFCSSSATESLFSYLDDTIWPEIAPQYCNGSQQSPINIVSASATPNANLTEFTFYNYSSTTALKSIENTGKTGEGSVWTGTTPTQLVRYGVLSRRMHPFQTQRYPLAHESLTYRQCEPSTFEQAKLQNVT